MRPNTDLKGYRYVPAAMAFADHGGVGIYIKYGKCNVDGIKVIEQNNQYLWVKAPDREFFIVRNSHYEHHVRPMNCNYDEFIGLSAFHKTFDDFDQDILMNNYASSMQKKNMDTDSIIDGKCNNNIITMTDSGGFQFMRSVDYLNPAKIAEWYNKNTHWGMVLDIPIIPGTELPLFKRAAIVQRSNSQIMLDTKTPHVDLINIVHGYSKDTYNIYRDIVETDDIDRMCLGGIYRGSILASVNNMLEIITKGKQYSHYHILGVYNPRVLPILIKIANSGLCKFITSDSSTAIRSATAKSYHVIRNFISGVERPYIGLSSNIITSSIDKVLPCGCPVCSKLKYVDTMAVLDGIIPTHMLMMHNIYVQKKYTQMLQDSYNQLSREEYRKLVKIHLNRYGQDEDSTANVMRKPKSKGISEDEVLHCLDFIDEVVDTGLEKARKKYAYYLNENSLVDTFYEPQSIFNDDGEKEEINEGDYSKRFVKILETYEKNTSSEHGKKQKIKLKQGATMFSKSKKSAKGLKKKTKSKNKKKAA